jgi:hypothetical protein
VKTLESKETRALKRATVTHNSVFAAHRLQCRMTIRKIDIRHFVLLKNRGLRRCNGLGSARVSRTLERVGLTGLEPVTLTVRNQL